jgi:hypothetical protein
VKYLDFLKVLLALGPKLAVVWPDVLIIFEAAKRIFATVQEQSPSDGSLNLLDATTEEMETETAIAAALVGEGSLAVFDGSRLRGLFKFAKDSGLLDALLAMLAKKALGG